MLIKREGKKRMDKFFELVLGFFYFRFSYWSIFWEFDFLGENLSFFKVFNLGRFC